MNKVKVENIPSARSLAGTAPTRKSASESAGLRVGPKVELGPHTTGGLG